MPEVLPPPGAHPHIRSFASRRGHLTQGQRTALETLHARYAVRYAAAPLDTADLFGNDRPVVMEIGCGMGETTARIAAANPGTNYLGVEVYPAGIGSLLNRIEAQELRNLRVIAHDAVEVLRHMIGPGQLAGCNIFFPDPWHKKRHHKRRLIQPPFVALLAARLSVAGILHCATDWLPYAEQMLAVLGAEPALRNRAPEGAGGFSPRPPSRPVTKFEQRGLALGHEVRDLVFERRATGLP